MNTTAAAKQAGVTVDTIRTWARMGAVRAAKAAGRWIIDAASLAKRIAMGIRRTRKVAPTMDLSASYTYYSPGRGREITVTPQVKERQRRGVRVRKIRDVHALLADKLAAIDPKSRQHVEELVGGVEIVLWDESDWGGDEDYSRDNGRICVVYQGHPQLTMDDMLDLAEAIRAHLDNV